jgi:hypothetical protein
MLLGAPVFPNGTVVGILTIVLPHEAISAISGMGTVVASDSVVGQQNIAVTLDTLVRIGQRLFSGNSTKVLQYYFPTQNVPIMLRVSAAGEARRDVHDYESILHRTAGRPDLRRLRVRGRRKRFPANISVLFGCHARIERWRSSRRPRTSRCAPTQSRTVRYTAVPHDTNATHIQLSATSGTRRQHARGVHNRAGRNLDSVI